MKNTIAICLLMILGYHFSAEIFLLIDKLNALNLIEFVIICFLIFCLCNLFNESERTENELKREIEKKDEKIKDLKEQAEDRFDEVINLREENEDLEERLSKLFKKAKEDSDENKSLKLLNSLAGGCVKLEQRINNIDDFLEKHYSGHINEENNFKSLTEKTKKAE